MRRLITISTQKKPAFEDVGIRIGDDRTNGKKRLIFFLLLNHADVLSLKHFILFAPEERGPLYRVWAQVSPGSLQDHSGSVDLAKTEVTC